MNYYAGGYSFCVSYCCIVCADVMWLTFVIRNSVTTEHSCFHLHYIFVFNCHVSSCPVENIILVLNDVFIVVKYVNT